MAYGAGGGPPVRPEDESLWIFRAGKATWAALSSLIIAGLTASRMVSTNASGQVDTPVTLTTDQSLVLSTTTGTALTVSSTASSTVLANWASNSVALTGGLGIYESLTVLGTTSGVGMFMSSGIAIFRTNAIGGAVFMDIGTVTIRDGNGSTAGGSIVISQNVTVNGTTDSTSKDTGSIVTEGGIGAEKGIVAGTHIRARGASVGALGVATDSETNPLGIAAWDSTKHVILAGPANSTTGSALAFSYDQTGEDGALVCLTPTVAWRAMSYNALTHDFFNGNSGLSALLIDSSSNVLAQNGYIKSSHATSGIGYGTGAGGTVTQITSRTTGVTLNKVCGQITLVSAAGSATWQSFTVTNSAVATTDVVSVCQDAGTDKYMIHVTAVGAGSFEITYATTGGTTTEQPVFNFTVHKAVAA